MNSSPDRNPVAGDDDKPGTNAFSAPELERMGRELLAAAEAEPLLPHGSNEDAVGATARDLSRVAGRLHASARAWASLPDRSEPLLGELADGSVAPDDPRDAVGLRADVSRREQLAA